MFPNLPLLPVYTHGTHRLATPQQTLARITPHLKACGITRCTEITGLDVDLGVATYCAIRPTALVLQSASGKGLTPLSAQVSALMEAIELHHAENPIKSRLQRASRNSLLQHGLNVITPKQLSTANEQFFSDDYVIDWVKGEELVSNVQVWVPASSVYFCVPAVCRTSTNGLASGNHLLEAMLHALFELIERDAISKIEVDGRLAIKEKCKVIDTTTIACAELQEIIRKVEDAQSKLVLLWVPSCLQVHTFWALLLNRAPFSPISAFTIGYGTHLTITIAAARAITEAVQSRLTLIHSSREDIIKKPVYQATYTQSSAAYRYFDNLKSDTTWQALIDQAAYTEGDLLQVYKYLLSNLVSAGHKQIIFVDLTDPEMDIPVVKMIIPSLQLKRTLF